MAGYSQSVGSVAGSAQAASDGQRNADGRVEQRLDARIAARSPAPAASSRPAPAPGRSPMHGGNTYTGGTTVLGGILQLGASGALPTGGNVTINSGGLDLQSFSNTVGSVNLTQGSISGSGTLTATAYAVQAGVVNAVLGGAAGLTKTGTGTLSINTAATFTGATRPVRRHAVGRRAEHPLIQFVGNGNLAGVACDERLQPDLQFDRRLGRHQPGRRHADRRLQQRLDDVQRHDHRPRRRPGEESARAPGCSRTRPTRSAGRCRSRAGSSVRPRPAPWATAASPTPSGWPAAGCRPPTPSPAAGR